MNPIKTLTVRLDDELHKEFKIAVASKGTDMQAVILESIKRFVQDSKAEQKK